MKRFTIIKCFIFAQCFVLLNTLFGQVSNFKVPYLLGEREIVIQENCYQSCNDKVLFINVHDNEQASRFAADSFLKVNNGMLVHIINDSSRNIDFTIGEKKYTIDPNRIFSKAGRLASLRLLSENKDDAAEPYVAYFARQLIKNYITKKSLIIALHNNSDSNFSIKTYVHLQDSIPHSCKIYTNPDMDEDDFIITSSLDIFRKIKTKKINVVWENVSIVKDDGSLSIYCSKHRIPYINVEAQHEHLPQQLLMLYSLKDIMSSYSARHKVSSNKKK